MAKTDYGPEVQSAMKETPADRARDKARGIKEGSAQDEKIDRQPGNRAPMQPMPANMQQVPRPAGDAPTPPDLHHVAAAASIAHAILGNRGLG